MKKAGEIFVGMKDVQSFTADDPEAKSTTVGIEAVQIEGHGDLILIRIVGSHFLWKMVRQIVGVIVEIGRGKLSLDDLRRYLTSASDVPAKLTAPPSGLFLERVCYKGDEVLGKLTPVMAIESGRGR